MTIIVDEQTHPPIMIFGIDMTQFTLKTLFQLHTKLENSQLFYTLALFNSQKKYRNPFKPDRSPEEWPNAGYSVIFTGGL